MHDSAMWWATQFLKNYSIAGKILEVGSCNVNGGLRDICPEGSEWVGVDLEEGPGVDIVLTDPHKLPFEDNSFDVILSSSVFEHTEFFWELFKEKCRCVKPGGYIYINAPSSGEYHPYPTDSWRFYRDAAFSLEKWAQHCGYPAKTLHASVDSDTRYCDFVAIYMKIQNMNIFTDYDLGKKLNYSYLNSNPFPNIVIDNFIEDSVAKKCFTELKNYSCWGSDSPENSYTAPHQVNKFYTPWCDGNIQDIKNYTPTVWNTLQYFNSKPFLNFLEDLTGIEGLIADSSFTGGGAHKIQSGGKLSLHVDYNLNQLNQFRVLNLLLYLNPEWEEEWEGALELWDSKNKKCAHKILPLFNRAAIFTLSDHSIHGHPIPLKCPEHIERYSLALYYFIEKPNQEFYERRAVVWTELPKAQETDPEILKLIEERVNF